MNKFLMLLFFSCMIHSSDPERKVDKLVTNYLADLFKTDEELQAQKDAPPAPKSKPKPKQRERDLDYLIDYDDRFNLQFDVFWQDPFGRPITSFKEEWTPYLWVIDRVDQEDSEFRILQKELASSKQRIREHFPGEEGFGYDVFKYTLAGVTEQYISLYTLYKKVSRNRSDPKQVIKMNLLEKQLHSFYSLLLKQPKVAKKVDTLMQQMQEKLALTEENERRQGKEFRPYVRSAPIMNSDRYHFLCRILQAAFLQELFFG